MLNLFHPSRDKLPPSSSPFHAILNRFNVFSKISYHLLIILSIMSLLALTLIIPGCGGASIGSRGDEITPTLSPTVSPTTSPTVSPTITPTPGFGNVVAKVMDFGTGSPIKSATVSIGSISGQTDDGGKCLLNNVPSGTQTIRATAANYNNYQDTVTVVANQTVQKEIFMTLSSLPEPDPGKGHILGYVKDHNGNGIAGVKCILTPRGATLRDTTITDNTGRYAFLNVNPGNYIITFELSGYTFNSVFVTVTAGGIANAPDATGSSGEGGDGGGGGGDNNYVYGTVTDSASGDPVPNSQVSLNYDIKEKGIKAISYVTYTDSNGAYEIKDVRLKKIPTGNARLIVSHPNYLPKIENITINPGANLKNINLDWKMVNTERSELLNDIWYSSTSLAIAVGEVGAIWRTMNDGANWTAVDPPSTCVLYKVWGKPDGSLIIAVGDAGTVLKSIDQGNSWKGIPLGQTYGSKKFTGIWGKNDGSDIYIVGANRDGDVILHSTDEGETWNQLYKGSDNNELDIWGHGNTLFVAGYRNKVLRSTNGGTVWQTVSNKTLTCLYGKPDGSAIFAVDGVAIYRSNDSGVSWTELYRVGSAVTETLRKIWITDDGANVYVAGGGAITSKIIYSNNGNAVTPTWNEYTANMQGSTGPRGVFGNTNGTSVIVVGDGGSIRRSTNNGITWNIIQGGHNVILADIWGQANAGAIYSAGWEYQTYNGVDRSVISRSIDGGNSWQTTYFTDGTDGKLLRAVWGTDDGSNVFVSGNEGIVYRSQDNGVTWVKIRNAVIPQFTERLFKIWGKPDGSTVFIVGKKGLKAYILRSTNATGPIDEITWTAVYENLGVTDTLYAIWGTPNGSVIYAAGKNGKILKSTDNGDNWTEVSGSGTIKDLTGIWGIPDATTIYMSGGNMWGSGPLSHVVIRSIDGGATWQTLEDGETINLNGVWGASVNDVYVAGGKIVHYVNGAFDPDTSLPPNVNNMYNLWGIPGEFVFTCGDNGRIYRKKLLP